MYLLTGVTGVLGSHVLYELIHSIHNQDYTGKLVLLVRSTKKQSAEQRVERLLASHLIPDYIREVDLSRIKANHLRVIPFQLNQSMDWKALLGADRYHLVHIAASVNLANTAAAREETLQTNYHGSLHLVETLLGHINKMTYVSTVFSSGRRTGVIHDNLLSSEPESFRSPYEASKAKSERALVRLCEAHGVAWQILRPSVVCGRTHDAPHFVISRFMVFYLFAGFFAKIRHRLAPDSNTRILCGPPDTGVNLVPVDYASKAIVRVLNQDIRELNIVSPNNTSWQTLLKAICGVLGIPNACTLVSKEPADKSRIETLYYRIVGQQLSHYMTSPKHSFDTSQLEALMHDVPAPDPDKHLADMLRYALSYSFINPDTWANDLRNSSLPALRKKAHQLGGLVQEPAVALT